MFHNPFQKERAMKKELPLEVWLSLVYVRKLIRVCGGGSFGGLLRKYYLGELYLSFAIGFDIAKERLLWANISLLDLFVPLPQITRD